MGDRQFSMGRIGQALRRRRVASLTVTSVIVMLGVLGYAQCVARPAVLEVIGGKAGKGPRGVGGVERAAGPHRRLHRGNGAIKVARQPAQVRRAAVGIHAGLERHHVLAGVDGLLYLALLLHDSGKAYRNGHHEEIGGTVALSVSRRRMSMRMLA